MPVVSPGTQFSSTNKTDRHDITEILLKHHNPNPKPLHFHIMLVVFFMDHSWKIFTYLNCFLIILYLTDVWNALNMFSILLDKHKFELPSYVDRC
jgi:hypothetical protein